MAKPYVTIELDKPRKLRFGMNALCALEDMLKMPMTKFSSLDIGFKEMRAMLWAGLQADDKSISLEQVGDLADEAGQDYVMQKVNEAINLAYGGKGKNNQGPVVGTGENPSN